MLSIYILSVLSVGVNDFWIRTSMDHTRNALHKEDMFMAEHLMSQGYKVYLPENSSPDKVVDTESEPPNEETFDEGEKRANPEYHNVQD